MIGRTISHYAVLEKIGTGGMGEVFKARDLRLSRFVAMKVLAAAHTGDRERRRRFVQEARAVSALNHPNITTLYDVFAFEGLHFMVMEFVDGVTLDEKIRKQSLNAQKTIEIAIQVTDGLQAAHAAGIIHRDLKPGNVMVTATGTVKILDFGIAKLTAPENTDSGPISLEGAILGTVCYMSPEQAQGTEVDARSDIFSFGVVLYEMLTSKKAFPNESGRSTMAALRSIIRDEPKPMGELAAGVPAELEEIVSKAMMKKPEDRWHSMEDMRAALMILKQQTESGWRSMGEMRGALLALKQQADTGQLQTHATMPAPATKIPWVAISIVAAVMVAVLAVGAGWFIGRRQQQAPVTAKAIPSPPQAAASSPAVNEPPAKNAETPAEAGMTNQSVLDLVKANVPQGTIINQIRTSKTDFDLSTKGVIQLSRGGVPPAMVEVMRNPKAAVAVVDHPVTRPAPVIPAPATPEPAAVPTPVPVEGAPVPPGGAPSPAPASPPPPVVVSIRTVSVPSGAALNISLAQDVPAKLTAGQQVGFTITRDLRIGDVVVVAKGTPLFGEVVDAGDTKKMLIVKSKATFKLTNVDSTSGAKLAIRATATHTEKGDHPIETPGSRNKNILAPAGTEYMAYIDKDQTMTVKP